MWDKTDASGKPVPSGEYTLILKEPVTFDYSVNGKFESIVTHRAESDIISPNIY
ncbi:hypothetical protein [Paenibacillus agricola]|uniref:hypothetical protein n=1 Tax=Paenibacillus agricola TaxID=2716264 RepID=UPI001A9D668A|nr:hypothetical protein [Paenibacillus agricola]